MNAELSKDELETIAKMVTEKLYAKFIAEDTCGELQKKNKEYANQMIAYYISENSVSYDVAKMIRPVIDKYLKETKEVESQLASYMTSDEFKKIELRHLEHRVSQLKDELYGED